MNDVQVALTADLIIDRFYYLKLRKSNCVSAMLWFPVRFTIDWTVISFPGWLNEYDAQREKLFSFFQLMKPMNKIITALWNVLRRIYQTSN